MKKKLAVFCAMILLLSCMVVLTGHASGIFGRKENTVTISQERSEEHTSELQSR